MTPRAFVTHPITGTTLPKALWAALLDLSPAGLDYRLRRWPLLRALHEPGPRAGTNWRHPLDEANIDFASLAALGHYFALRRTTEDNHMPFDDTSHDAAAAAHDAFRRTLDDLALLEKARPDRVAEIVAIPAFDEALAALGAELLNFTGGAHAH